MEKDGRPGEGESGGRHGPERRAAGRRSQLLAVELVSGLEQGDHHSSLAFERDRLQPRAGRQLGFREQLLELALDAGCPQEDRDTFNGLGPHRPDDTRNQFGVFAVSTRQSIDGRRDG